MPSTLPPFRRVIALAALLAFALPCASHGQNAPKKEISDEVSAAFGKLRELTDAKNFTAALAQLDALLATAGPESFDRALIAQIKAQILLADGKFSAAVEPLETALALGERHAFFETSALQEQRYMLAQIYCQLAAEEKEIARQRPLYDRASDQLARWFASAARPTAEAHLLAASLLYNRATLTAGEPDALQLRQARGEAEKGLALQARPNFQLYILILAALQQLGDARESADILELLVKHQPDSSTYWQQLAATYLGLAADTKDEAASFRYHLRAILTIERAQARGLLNSPKDRLNLVAIYFNIHQFDRAAMLLEKGLADGSLENQRRNWELLASAYQQLRQSARTIDAFERAIRSLPKDGQCEFGLAQFHYGQGRADEAYRHLEAAAAKGGLDQPGQAKLFTAYVACELQRYDDAARWLEIAARHDDVKKDDLARLDRAVRDALRERAALREAKL
jgi:Tfp pilus assembly protein PilF